MNMPNLVKELEVEVEFLAERIAPPPSHLAVKNTPQDMVNFDKHK